MSNYTMVERNNKLYAREPFLSDSEPVQYFHYWQLHISWPIFASWFASPEIARLALGKPMEPTISHPTIAWSVGNLGFFHVQGSTSKPALSKHVAIPEPVQTGRKTRLQWHKQAWYKQTSKAIATRQKSSLSA